MAEHNAIIDFEKVCRTCLAEAEDMKPLFEECVSDVCLVEMLMSCTFVEYALNDGLPCQICKKCLNEISRAYKFAEKCARADKILQKCLNLIGKQYDDMRHIRKRVERKPVPYLTIVTQDDTQTEIKKEPKPSLKLATKSANSNIYVYTYSTNDGNTPPSDNDGTPIKLEDDHGEEPESPADNRALDKYENILTEAMGKTEVGGSESDTSDASNIPGALDATELPFNRKPESQMVKMPVNKLKSGPPFECKKCNASFPLNYLLREHFRKAKHTKKDYANRTCPVCSKSVSYSHYNHHLRTHTSEKPYCCEFCGKRFVISSNLIRHKRTHSGEKPYKCDLCEKAFTQSTNLRDHRRTHTGEKPYVCNVCGKAFGQTTSFKLHLKRHEKEAEEGNAAAAGIETPSEASDASCKQRSQPIKCEICQQYYKTPGALKTHLMSHADKKFMCTDCGRGFVSMKRLQNHAKAHSDDKPFHCLVCNKAFVLKTSLKNHMYIHTGEKPYSCSMCEKSFTQLGQLRYHQRTHSGERPYSCSYCGKTFALNGNLTVHMRTHTGETPYMCAICQRGFYDSSSLKKHLRGHGQKV